MKSIKEANINNKKVIIRCDLNVPLNNNRIIDDTRIKESIPTIEYCLKYNCKIILLSHFGRIKTKEDLKKYNLNKVAKRLSKILNKEVKFINQTRGNKLEEAINNMNYKDIILVQNTRYEDLNGNKESGNDKELGKYWASLGDVYINDAFGTLHRKHASNYAIAKNIDSYEGLLIEKELKHLDELKHPEKPFILVLGGSKVSDKIGIINKLAAKADKILIGGGMCFTFLKSEGFETGNSILDNNSINYCNELLTKYPDKIILPIDVKVSKEYLNNPPIEKDITDIDYNEMGLDIGSKTVKIFKKYLKDAKIVMWNGPLGVYEFSNYKKSTNSILKYLVNNNIKTILGGGDIVAAAKKTNVKDKIYHISTGGGATLEYIEGKKLPGLEAIK